MIVDKLPYAEHLAFGLDGTLYVSQLDQGTVYKVKEISLFYTGFLEDSTYLTVDTEGDIWIRGLNYMAQISPEGIEKPYTVDGLMYNGTTKFY